MKRDYSLESKGRLKLLINEIGKQDGFSDFFGDMFAANVDISNYVNNVHAYHRAVLDKNNTTMTKIDTIFANVAGVDRTYRAKMSIQCSSLNACCNFLSSLSSIMANSRNIHSNSFSINSIQKVMSPALMSYYMDKLRAGTGEMDLDGNEKYDYNYEYIRQVMQQDAHLIPAELYNALIGTFTDMGIEDKEKFLENSYVEVGRYTFSNEQEELVTWQAGSALVAMTKLYQAQLDNMSVSFDMLKQDDNEYHKCLFNCSLLTQIIENANPTYTVNKVCYNGSQQTPYIEILKTDSCIMKWDYTVQFPEPSGRLPINVNTTSPISIFQFRDNLDNLLDDEGIIKVAESMRVNILNELYKLGVDTAADLLPDFLKLIPVAGKGLSLVCEGGLFVSDVVNVFSDTAKTNASVDSIINLVKDGNTYGALHMGASISMLSDGSYDINKASFDSSNLNLALRAYALDKEDGARGYTADSVVKAFNDGKLGELDINDYVEWFGKANGEGKVGNDYIKKLEHALENSEFKDKDISKLTYDEMVELESSKYFK